MQRIIRYSLMVFIVAVTVAACKQRGPVLPSLEETFSRKDKIPFGTHVAFSQMEQLYPQNTVSVKKQKFETSWEDMSDTGALYVLVSKNLFLTKADLTAMLQYVHAGNTMFIAVDNIDFKLLDTLGCSISDNNNGVPGWMRYTNVSLMPARYNDTSRYSYFYYPFSSKFLKYDTVNTQVLGVNQYGSANFIVQFYGKGRFYLHTEPRSFSNYFLLQKMNYKYLQNILAYTNPQPEQLYWDDYYGKKNFPTPEEESEGSFNFLLKYPALRWAFWLTLLLLAIYIFFGGKRRQRIIEVVVPNKNTTVAFTETVGRLYLQQRNNRNIADKVILYFFEHIRTQYYLNTNQISDTFIATLSRKSNVPVEQVKRLFETIRIIQNNYDVSDQQLLSLNHQIENFNKTNS